MCTFFKKKFVKLNSLFYYWNWMVSYDKSDLRYETIDDFIFSKQKNHH